VKHRSTEEPRPPRSEPEIIPPDRPDRASFRRPGGTRRFGRRVDERRVNEGRGDEGRPQPRVDLDGHQFARVYIARPRPFSIVLAVLALVAVAAALVVFLLGTFLIALPLIGTIVLVAFITAFIRGNRREMR
jgi:hypothetical protein